MIKNLNPNNILLFALSVFLVSCIEKELDFDSIKSQNWSSEWAIPLINSSVTLDDLIKDSTALIHEGEDGLLVLVFESQEFFSYSSEDIPFIPNQEKILDRFFNIPDLLPGISVEVPVSYLYELETDEPGARIDSCNLKSGSYTLVLTTNLNKDYASVHLTLPGLLDKVSGNPVEFTFDAGYPVGGGLIVRDTTIDLSSCTLKFNNTPGHSNELLIDAIVTVFGDDNPNNSPYSMQLKNSFSDLVFSRSFGYIGTQVITLQDTIEMDIFDINEEGNFTFGPGSVNMRVSVKNSFGIPVLMDIVNFRAYHYGSTVDSVDIFIFGEGNPSQFNINYPGMDQIGQYVLTEINTENSNISEAIQISPGFIRLEMDGHLNPDSDSTVYNFALDTSFITADVSVEMSLFGGINGFNLTDTVDFDLGDVEEITSLLLVVDAQNFYPIEARLQLDFVDSVYQVVHTLLPAGEQLISAAPVGSPPKYRITGPVQKITNVILNEDEIKAVQKASKIIINATLSSTNGQLVKIYNDYKVDLKIGAKVGITY
jgi:hypothetical protein